MERAREHEQDGCRLENAGKMKIIIEEKKKSGSSKREWLNSGEFLLYFVIAFTFVGILHKFQSMLEDDQKKPVKKEERKVDRGQKQ